MVEPPFGVIKPEQKRADFATAAFITKAADDAIGCPHALDLDHRPLAALISTVEPLGDDAVGSA